MESKKHNLLSALKSFWFLSSATILLAFALAIWAYRLKFGGALSSDSDDWSNFGSYMGGIFGPLVSFVTLLAVLKTVYLQRELLDAQTAEFERMNVLQQQTFDAQLNQMTSAASDARKLQVSASQDTAIKVIDQHISIYDKKMAIQNDILYELIRHADMRKSAEDKKVHQDLFDEAIRQRDAASVAIDQLAKLSTTMAVSHYQSPDQVRRELLSGLESVSVNTKT